jgi:hypothetical protein
MPEATSASTFLGNKVVRDILYLLWISLRDNELKATGLIFSLNNLVLEWEKSVASMVSSHEAHTVGVSE